MTAGETRCAAEIIRSLRGSHTTVMVDHDTAIARALTAGAKRLPVERNVGFVCRAGHHLAVAEKGQVVA